MVPSGFPANILHLPVSGSSRPALDLWKSKLAHYRKPRSRNPDRHPEDWESPHALGHQNADEFLLGAKCATLGKWVRTHASPDKMSGEALVSSA